MQNTVGTLQNRLQFAISLAQSQVVNNKAAESRIRDANIAEESANLTRFNILTQSGIAALAQANSQSDRCSRCSGKRDPHVTTGGADLTAPLVVLFLQQRD